MASSKISLPKPLLAFFALLLAFCFSISMFGCAGSSQSSNTAKDSASETDSDYEEITFHDISVAVPKDAEITGSSDDDTMLVAVSTSKSFGALTIHLQYSPEYKLTAKDAYDAFSEFEDCELVSSNGIEICIQDEGSYSGRMTYRYTFAYNGVTYNANIDYDSSSQLGYEEYVESFYKSIKGISTESSAKVSDSTESPKSTMSSIPDGAVEWSKASQYVGKTATFYGKVVDAEYASSSNSSPTFLDLGAAYPDTDRLSIVIWGKNRKNFSSAPESLYKGKTIAVTGEVYKYDGVCNIEVSSPSQIKELK